MSKIIAIAIAGAVAFAAVGAAIAADLKAKGSEQDKSTTSTTTTTDEHDKCWTKGKSGKLEEHGCPKPKVKEPEPKAEDNSVAPSAPDEPK